MELITSFESGGQKTFGDVFTCKPELPEMTVGILGLGYFEYWRMYPALCETVRQDLDRIVERLRQELPGVRVVYSGMVDTLDRAGEAGDLFAREQVQAVIVVAGTYLPDFITLEVLNRIPGEPRLILFNTQTGADLSPDDQYVDTMRNSSLIAVSQLTGSLRKMKREYQVVVGDNRDADAYRQIRQLVEAMCAVRELRHSTFGLIGHVFRGMYDLEFDRARVRGFLGPEILALRPDFLVECWEQVPEEESAAAAAALLERFPCRDVELDDIRRSCRIGLAMRRLCRRFGLDGLCFLGQHYLEKITGAPARMGASMLLEEDRIPVCCEGDIGGLVMMKLLQNFTGTAPFQAEWGQFDLKSNALFLLGHGIGSPALAGDGSVVLTHSPEEWGFKGSGLNYELILKPGTVTMGHFLNTGDSWRLLVSRGESLGFPRLECSELHAMVKVQSPVREYLTQVLEKGAAHHLIVAHGDAVKELLYAAKLMRIESFFIE